jgi:hypothetical protein
MEMVWLKTEVDPFKFGAKSLLDGQDLYCVLRTPSRICLPVWRSHFDVESFDNWADYLVARGKKYSTDVLSAHVEQLKNVQPVYQVLRSPERFIIGPRHDALSFDASGFIHSLASAVIRGCQKDHPEHNQIGGAPLDTVAGVSALLSLGFRKLGEGNFTGQPFGSTTFRGDDGVMHHFVAPESHRAIVSIETDSPAINKSSGYEGGGWVKLVYYRYLNDGSRTIEKMEAKIDIAATATADRTFEYDEAGLPIGETTSYSGSFSLAGAITEKRLGSGPSEGQGVQVAGQHNKLIGTMEGVDTGNLATFVDGYRAIVDAFPHPRVNGTAPFRDVMNAFSDTVNYPTGEPLQFVAADGMNLQSMYDTGLIGFNDVDDFLDHCYVERDGKVKYEYEHLGEVYEPSVLVGYTVPFSGMQRRIGLDTSYVEDTDRYEIHGCSAIVELRDWRKSLDARMTSPEVLGLADKLEQEGHTCHLHWCSAGDRRKGQLSNIKIMALPGAEINEVRGLEVDGGERFSTLGGLEALNAKESEKDAFANTHVVFGDAGNSASAANPKVRRNCMILTYDPSNETTTLPFMRGYIDGTAYGAGAAEEDRFVAAWEHAELPVFITNFDELKSAVGDEIWTVLDTHRWTKASGSHIKKLVPVPSEFVVLAANDSGSDAADAGGGPMEWYPVSPPFSKERKYWDVTDRTEESRFMQTAVGAKDVGPFALAMVLGGYAKGTMLYKPKWAQS